jgi:hypothetical protein
LGAVVPSGYQRHPFVACVSMPSSDEHESPMPMPQNRRTSWGTACHLRFCPSPPWTKTSGPVASCRSPSFLTPGSDRREDRQLCCGSRNSTLASRDSSYRSATDTRSCSCDSSVGPWDHPSWFTPLRPWEPIHAPYPLLEGWNPMSERARRRDLDERFAMDEDPDEVMKRLLEGESLTRASNRPDSRQPMRVDPPRDTL